MKSLQNQYNLIKEGKGNKDVFVKSAKTQFPDIPNYYGFNETVNELKYRNILNEGMLGIVSAQPTVPDWFKLFNESINEAKAEEKKPTKEVVDMETRGFDYKDKKNIDNVYGEQFLKGFYTEMQDPKNEEKTVEELKSIVAKNLAKDQLHYVKDGQFGIKGVGYTTEHPGLGTPKEAKGKYKSSGYGNLNESLKNKQYYKNIAYLDKRGLAKKQFSDEDIQTAKKMLSNGEFNLNEVSTLGLSGIKSFAKKYNLSLKSKKSGGRVPYVFLTKDGKEFGPFDPTTTTKDSLLKKLQLNESLNENTLVDIENQLLDANIGDMAYGGGYGPFEKVTRNTWKNVKANSLSNSESLASFIGGFNDFRIESSRPMSENQIRKAIRLIIKEELNKI